MDKKYSVTLDFNAENIKEAVGKFIKFCREEDIEVLEDTFYFKNKIYEDKESLK